MTEAEKAIAAKYNQTQQMIRDLYLKAGQNFENKSE